MKIAHPSEPVEPGDISITMEVTEDRLQFILMLKSDEKMNADDAMMAIATFLAESGIPIKLSREKKEPC